MLAVIRYGKGYVRLQVSGFGCERFLNLCNSNGIDLWDMHIEDFCCQMCISIRDYFKIKPFVKKTKVKVVLLQKIGLPFRLKKIKKRKAFVIGLFACLISLYLLSEFIWDIELIGGVRMTEDMLIPFLEEEGVSYGTYAKHIPIEQVEQKLRDSYPFIVWTSIQKKGTRLYVEIKENDSAYLRPQEKLKECDLCATVSGTVDSIITRNGVPKVKAGDCINKGDVLVSGLVTIMNDDETVRDYMRVPSSADIFIRTELPYQDEVPLRYMDKVYTGREKKVYYFKLFTKAFAFGGKSDYGTYDVVTDLKQGKLTENFYLPLYYGTIIYREYELASVARSQKEANQILEKNLRKFCETLDKKGIQIIEKNVKIEKNEKLLAFLGKLVVLVKDGEPREIPYLSDLIGAAQD